MELDHLADVMVILRASVNRIITSWIQLLSPKLFFFVTWPTREQIKSRMPRAFHFFPNTSYYRLYGISATKAFFVISKKNFSHINIGIQALRGHMTYDIINTQHVDTSVEIVTLAGTSLRLFRDDDTMDLFVSGSHVTARVTEMDIQCSNGVIYVIDEVLHLPVRTTFQELKRHPNLSYMCTLFESLRNHEFNLSDTQRDLTVFVAANEAFSYLPWPSVDLLMRDLDRTHMILRAHVVPDEKRYLNEISDGTGLPAFQNVIYLLTVNNKRYVINNNLWAEVLTSDIPAVNGRVHIIRRLLYIPYDSIMQLLKNMDETRFDYCNSLLTGCSSYLVHKLQKVQNSAACLVIRASKPDHVIPLLHILHRLPIRSRIQSMTMLCFNFCAGSCPISLSPTSQPDNYTLHLMTVS